MHTIRSIFTFFLFLPLSLKAQQPEIILHNYNPLLEENKRQWDDRILYRCGLPGCYLYLEKNTITYLFYDGSFFHRLRHDPKHDTIFRTHCVKAEWLDANRQPVLMPSGPEPFYHNYFIGNDSSRWSTGVKQYHDVTYKNIYDNIDLHFSSGKKHLKYDLVIHPGGDISQVKIRYSGADHIIVKNGNLIWQTPLGMVTELKPVAWQVVNGIRQPVEVSYDLKENVLSFTVSSYNASLPLVIDPTLIVSTFTGSTADNWGFTATFNAAGNIYTGGIAASIGYPTSAGAYQAAFGGGGTGGGGFPFDISITKFNPTGTSIVYSTYLGGMDNEQPMSLVANASDQLFIYGRTYSSNFPVTGGAYDNTNNGGSDIVVCKFNSTGTSLLASTFVGASSDDAVSITADFYSYSSLKYNYADDGRGEIQLDNSGNVCIASCTQSSGFPVTPGSYDGTFNGGFQDACVFKMNSSLSSLLWSTFLGGSSDDAAYGIAIDDSDNVYVTGGTNSGNFPTTAGVLFPSFLGGAADGYVTKFAPDGASLQASTYVGTGTYDQSHFIQMDASGNVYIYGQTTGSYPVSPGVYSNSNGKQFIHKINNSLSATVYSTVFGSGSAKPNICPSAFMVDTCENVFCSGWADCFGTNTGSTSGMTVTGNAYQSTTDGCDFYFFVLNTNATSLWYATYFGGSGDNEHVDGGTSRFDNQGIIYQSVCAGCGGSSAFPTTAGAWSNTNNSTNCNNAVIKMNFQLTTVQAIAGLQPDDTICPGQTINFTNSSVNADSYIWNFGDGSPVSTAENPSHLYSDTGDFIVWLIANNSTGCLFPDTDYLNVTVLPPPDVFIGNDTTICGTTAILLNAGNPGMSWTWSTGATTQSILVTTTGIYSVSVSNGSCTSDDTIIIAMVSKPDLGNDTALCQSEAPVILNGGNPGCNYLWTTGETTQLISVSASGQYAVTVSSDTCTVADTIIVNFLPLPVVSLGNDTPVCPLNINVLLDAGNPGCIYQWSTGSTNQVVVATLPGIYTVTVTDANGCMGSGDIEIKIPDSLIAGMASKFATCNTSDGTASVTTGGGVPPYIYNWSTGAYEDTITGIPSGNYTVTITDLCGTSVTGTIAVNDTGAPIITVASFQNVRCFGLNDGKISVAVSGGAPPLTFLWNNNSQDTSLSNLQPGNYSLTVSDVIGCKSILNITVTEPLPLAVTMTATDVTCLTGGTATTTPAGGITPYSFQWNTGVVGTQYIASLQPGVYSVTVTDSNGCSITDTAIVNPAEFITATAAGGGEICGPQPLTLSAGGGTEYQWSTGASGSMITVMVDSTTVYTVLVTDGYCSDTAFVTVIVHPQVMSDAGIDTAIYIEESAALTGIVTGGTSPFNLQWMPGSSTNSTITVTPAVTTQYYFSVTDSEGCTAIDSVMVVVMPCDAAVFVPNAFAPGCRCPDDRFRVYSDCIKTMKLFVYHRWGEKVFESTDPAQGWDGNFKGKPMDAGTYVYILKYTTVNKPDEEMVMEGNVILLR